MFGNLASKRNKKSDYANNLNLITKCYKPQALFFMKINMTKIINIVQVGTYIVAIKQEVYMLIHVKN